MSKVMKQVADTVVNEAPVKRKGGFAAISPERRREIASMGGKAAHASGTAHQWTPDEAAEAGRKGGLVRQGKWKK